MRAIAANIPPELFDRILDCLQLYVASSERGDNSFVRVKKRELSSCSMTCRFWAKCCRPRIFNSITLRSRDDVYELLAFFDRPQSPLTRYIKFLTFQQDGTCEPWIHLVFVSILPRLSPTVWTSLYMNHPPDLSSSRPPLRSIHALLPRSLPSTFSNFYEIELNCIQFRSFDDLARLVREIPTLGQLRCHKLTWPVEAEALGLRRTAPYLCSIKMSECTNSWPAIWFLVGRRSLAARARPEPEQLFLDPHENFILGKLTQSIKLDVPDSTGNEAKPVGHLHRLPEGKGYCVKYSLSLKREHSSYSPKLAFVIEDVIDSSSNNLGRVEVISVDFTASSTELEPVPVDMLSSDWETFDEHVSQLTHLRKFVLGFNSLEELSQFVVEVIEPRMPHMQTSGKCAMGVWDKKKERWSYASSITGPLQEPNGRNLHHL